MSHSELIMQIKKCSSVSGKQKPWILKLNDDQIYEIFFRLQNGEGIRSLGRIIQEDWGYMTKSSTHSLAQGIRKFRNRTEHLFKKKSNELGIGYDLNQSKLDDYDDLEKLEFIADKQSKRIESMIIVEQKEKIRNPNISKEILALVSLQKTIDNSKEQKLHRGGNIYPNIRPFLLKMNRAFDEVEKMGNKIDEIEFENKMLEGAELLLDMYRFTDAVGQLTPEQETKFFKLFPRLAPYVSKVVHLPD